MHNHNVYDTDNKFTIDGITRAIKNVSSSKTTVMQFDHNSEVFTFEVPRYIEGHDMTECNRVKCIISTLTQSQRKKTRVFI